MTNRTNVNTMNTELLDQELIWKMVNATPQRVGSMKKRISDLIEKRREIELTKGDLSKDFVHLESWTENEAVARLFIGLEIDATGYILNRTLSDADLTKRGFDPDAKTSNLKAYKKVKEVAEYVISGRSKLEAVFKTFVACSIIASRHSEVIPRDVCEKFLSSNSLSHVSDDLQEAIDAYQAKHMTGGASTQTSQMTLTLANLGAARVMRDGRSKHIALNPSSPLLAALAARFGMSEQLDKLAS